MKYITKGPQPQELIAWRHTRSQDQENNPVNWGYDDMPGAVRAAVKAQLIREQGGLCCYTGRWITAAKSHIEHLKPQSQCTGHEDVDYRNLLAAYPSSEPYTSQCSYGAHAKGDWYDEYLFVHPLRRDCEQRLRYNFNGNVNPSNSHDDGAMETISRLCLNDGELKKMRTEAIYEALFETTLNKRQAERLRDAMDQRDSNGCFRQFCFVIKQACEKYLKRFDKS
jgi:uncharacterized protein (TIGR02646 family)